MYANWSQSASIYHSEHLNHTNPLNSRVRNKRGWHLYFTHLDKIMQPSSFVPTLLNSLIRVNPFPLNEIKTERFLNHPFYMSMINTASLWYQSFFFIKVGSDHLICGHSLSRILFIPEKIYGFWIIC